MHVGSTKASTNQSSLLPPLGFSKVTTLSPSKKSTSSLPLVAKMKKESEVNKRSREHKHYDKLIETQPIKVPQDSIITFCKHFKYLGNYISYNLTYDYNITHRFPKHLQLWELYNTSGPIMHLIHTVNI